jgi:hypothetical protein
MSQMAQLTRRGVLAGGGAAVLLAALSDTAAASAPPAKPVADPPLDATHATPELAVLAVAQFKQKAARNVSGFTSFFSRRQLVYSDAIWGGQWRTWRAFEASMAVLMAEWPPTANCYPVKVIGDTRSGVVFFYNNPQLFGHELRVISAWDFRDQKIDRQVDYWDGRHFTIAASQALKAERTGPFPAEFGENEVPEQAPAVLRQLTTALSSAFATGNAAAAAALFSSDAMFEDLTLHATMVGQQAIGGFLDRGLSLLPYGQAGALVRHVVGTAQGGGYEWKNTGATVPNGIIALELNGSARITWASTVWDGSLVTDQALTQMLAATIEH